LLLPSASDTESALLQRIERIETRMDISIPAGEAAMSTGAPAAAPAKQYVRKTQAPAPAAVPAPEPVAQPASPAPVVEVPEPEPVAEAPKPEPVAEAPRPAPEPEPTLPPPPATEPAAPPTAAAGEPGAAAVRSMWSTVREKVRQRSRTTEVMLAGAIVRAVENNTLILGHESAPLAKRLSEQRNADVIRDALKDALGVDWRVRCEVGVGQPVQEVEPLPPEPEADPVEVQRAEEDSMIAEVGRDEDTAPRRDPEEVALELLQSELGARRIDG
jgi:DNA polymerase-3 subunit gamma/tau